MPQSKWWKQCICTVLEIRMHEYVKNMVNGLLDVVLWLHGLSKLGGKFKLIKDSDFSPLGQIQSYLDPNPITTLKRPLDLFIGALIFCWLLDEEQAIERKISRDLRELTLDTWELEWYALPIRVQRSILCSLLS